MNYYIALFFFIYILLFQNLSTISIIIKLLANIYVLNIYTSFAFSLSQFIKIIKHPRKEKVRATCKITTSECIIVAYAWVPCVDVHITGCWQHV